MLPINVPSGQFKGTPLSRKRLTVFKMFAFSLIAISLSFPGKLKFGTCKLLSTREPQQARCVCAPWWYVTCRHGKWFPELGLAACTEAAWVAPGSCVFRERRPSVHWSGPHQRLWHWPSHCSKPSPKELSYGPRCGAGSSFMGGLISSQSKTWFLPEVWGVFMWVLVYVTLFRQHIFVLLWWNSPQSTFYGLLLWHTGVLYFYMLILFLQLYQAHYFS